MELKKYSTFVFDCDGVILNSNSIKTEAFYNSALPYGESAALALARYHVANGGVSRYKKFEFFLKEIVADNCGGPTLEELLLRYASEVRNKISTCEVAEGLEQLRSLTAHSKWLIVSGGDQLELRDIFMERGLDTYFDGGIFGSPDTKYQILERETLNGNIKSQVLFLGDSKYDFEAAERSRFDFMFVSDWSESDFDFPNAKYKVKKLMNLIS